jgi:hypothetical protein
VQRTSPARPSLTHSRRTALCDHLLGTPGGREGAKLWRFHHRAGKLTGAVDKDLSQRAQRPILQRDNSGGIGNLGHFDRQQKEIDRLTVAADKVLELACEGNAWAVEHIANRLDGKVRDQVEPTTNHNVKVRYESYEEVRAALLEEGINIDRLPMLQDMRPPEEQDRN